MSSTGQQLRPGWRVVHSRIHTVPDSRGLLQPYKDVGVSMSLKCGCGRKFCTAEVFNPRDDWVVLVLRGMSFSDTEPWPEDRPRRTPRPQMTFEYPGEGHYRFRCRPDKCGRSWSVTDEEMVASFVRAARAGRRELVFGDNL